MDGLDFALSGGLDFVSALGLDFASALGFRLCVDPFTLNCTFTNIYVAIDSSIEFSELSVEVDIFF